MRFTIRKSLSAMVTALLLSQVSLGAWAGAAEVLPKGVKRAGVSYTDYFPIDERYGSDGDREDAAIDFNANLNSSVFTAISLIEAGFTMPPGSGTLGNSVVDFEYDNKGVELVFQYGLTDKLTIGAKIPYLWQKNKVSADVDTSTATLGINPAHGTGVDPFNGAAPLIPIGLGGVPVTADDVQNILGAGLTINGAPAIPGFGYEPVATWSDDGVGDIEIGGRYQYFKNDDWRLAFTGGVKLPTGEVDSPDNLVDLEFGLGAPAVMLTLGADYTGIDKWVFSGSLRYDFVLSEDELLRVPFDVNVPITTNEEKVDRDIGDYTWVDLAAKYKYNDTISLTANYVYTAKEKDDVKGDLGLPYDELEEETDKSQHVMIAGFTYSTVSQYMEKKAKIPMTIGLNYRWKFKGKNNALDSEYLQAAFAVYF